MFCNGQLPHGARQLALIALLACACGSAEAVPPGRAYPELPATLRALHQFVVEWNDRDTANQMFDLPIELQSCDLPIKWSGGQLATEVMGAYHHHVPAITIRTCQPALLDTALLHELFQHRYPHIIFGHPNLNHDPEWVGMENIVRQQLQVLLY